MGTPKTPAKKSETELSIPPVSFADVWTATVRAVLSRLMELTLLWPSSAFWLARLVVRDDVVEQNSLSGVPGAFLGRGDGRRVRAVLQLRPLGVDGADVDGDCDEAEKAHHKQGHDDCDAALFGGFSGRAPSGRQPPHSMTPFPVIANGPAIPVIVDRL